MTNVTVSTIEVDRFNKLADQWWDPNGPMRVLHLMNTARVDWIVARIDHWFANRQEVRLLDVGCGAGLAAEAFALRKLNVLGIDAAKAAVGAGRVHAGTKGKDLSLMYRHGLAEDLLAERVRFEVIVALEVIEHVPDPDAFLTVLRQLLIPGGLLFVSTLNRTLLAFLTAKIGAEHLARWLPVGTHHWHNFITPAELAGMLRNVGLLVGPSTGLTMSLADGGWAACKHQDVNYIMQASS